jgi:hypothetical protein
VNETYWIEDFYGTYSLVATPDGGYALAGSRYFGPVYLIPLGAAELGETEDGGETTEEKNFKGNPSFSETPEKVYPAVNETAYSMGLWLVKTDAFGNTLWNHTYEGIMVTYAPSLVKTPDGGYAIASEGHLTSEMSHDVLLTKTDALGNIQWQQVYEKAAGTGGVKVHSLIKSSDGGYALAGETTPAATNYDFWLVKTDEFGVVPEYTSWVAPSLVLAAAVPILFYRKRLLRRCS